MTYQKIDMATFPRRAHFAYFTSLAYPYVGVSVPVDVSALLAFCRKHHYSFFLTMMHAVILAANEVPEFRQRIDGTDVIMYDFCHSSHTELLPDRSYCYCTVKHDADFQTYIRNAERAREKARIDGSIDEDEDVNSLIFVSSLPWLHYTELIQPVNGNQDANPRISWGKYEADAQGRMMMPVSVLAHHALVDGVHLGLFYQHLEAQIAQLSENDGTCDT